MKILFIASKSDWHIDLWVRYFTKSNNIYLFTDKEDYLNRMYYKRRQGWGKVIVI